MYDLPYFKENDRAIIIEFIKNHPFGMLIGSGANGPSATQLPFLLEERNNKFYLQAHFMKGTDHHKAFHANSNALCVFTGAQAYVSASWYQQPKTASTWNYMSVHCRGVIEFQTEAWLMEILEKTTAYFENNPQSPASFQHLSPKYVSRLAKAIIGIEIEVKSLDAVFKLSQNADKESYDSIINKLEAKNEKEKEIATEMRKRKASLFP
ncbi:MAG: FMN-binding negative transcriptional regulator [Chitinophagaceae bacterium]